VPALNDPDFAASCAGKSGNYSTAWGLWVLNSHDVLVYGAGFYSFFSDYSTCKLPIYFPIYLIDK
jgi:glucan 1,3-beta-glucosidase